MLRPDALVRLHRARRHLAHAGPADTSIAEIASAAGMSRFHFTRRFKAVFGDTPSQCRTRARLDRARQLLAETDDPVTDVCLAVGFSSLGSFSALFARHCGLSPTAYRQHNSQSVESRTPHCLALQRLAWEKQAQISRSAKSQG